MRDLDELHSFSNTDPEYLIRPLDVVDRGRDDWCATDAFGTLLVWGRDQVLEVLDHPDLWAATVEQSSLGALTEGPAVEWTRRISSFCDGEVHRRQRRAAGPAFRSAAMEAMRPQIRAVAQEAVGRVAAGEVELVEDLCFRFPMEVFAAVLGTDPERLAPLADDISALSRLWGYDAGQWAERIDHALPRISEVATELRRRPAGVVERIENIDLDEDMRQALVIQLIVAGWETTASQAACILWTLTSRPDRWAVLAAGEHPVGAIVQESIRWQPSASGAMRLARCDTVLADVAVPEGTRVFASFLWASRDAGAYPQPETWRPDRYTGPSPAPLPLAFSAGRHSCLGEKLALVELEELVAAFVSHGPPQGWEVIAEPEWTDHRRPRRPVDLVARPRS